MHDDVDYVNSRARHPRPHESDRRRAPRRRWRFAVACRVIAPTPHNPRTIHLHSCQTLTPETATTTQYFFQQVCRADQGDEAIARIIHEQLLVAFEEDRAMITAQARNLALRPDAPLLPLAMDAALIEFRRLVAERQGEPTRAPSG